MIAQDSHQEWIAGSETLQSSVFWEEITTVDQITNAENPIQSKIENNILDVNALTSGFFLQKEQSIINKFLRKKKAW
jgi:hypothetical protein